MILGVILVVIGFVLMAAALVGIWEYIRAKEFGLALLALVFAIIPAIVTIFEGVERVL